MSKMPKTAHPSEQLLNAAVEEIAARILRIEALEARLSERHDLHTRHVADLRDALRAAYAAGFVDGIVAARG